MIRSTLRGLFGFGQRVATKPRFRPQARLCLELLENRLVPSTLHVGSSAGGYPDIQAAVTAAHTNDTIIVDPGTYTGQVTIGAGKDGISLVGAGQGISFIQAVAVSDADDAVVEINGAKNVKISGFTISVSSMIIITDPNANHQTNGIVVDGAASSAQITHDTVIGLGPNPLFAHGIVVRNGAGAVVSQNNVSGNESYLSTGYTSTGILLNKPGAVTVDHNTLSNNDYGIVVLGSSLVKATGVDVDHNQVTTSTLVGILLDYTSGIQVSHNVTDNNGSGTPAQGGISINHSTNSTIDHNESMNNSGDGIYVDGDSTGNVFIQNQLGGNTVWDAQDQSSGSGTAGTGNIWNKNLGATSSPSGLVS